MSLTSDWGEAIGSDLEGCEFHTLELALEYYDCQQPEDMPEVLQCMAYKTPVFEAGDLVDSLIEQLNDNYRNDEGHIGDFITDSAQLALAEAFQPLIDKLILDCGWKQYEPTEFQIDLASHLKNWRKLRAMNAAGLEQLSLDITSVKAEQVD